MGSYFRICGTWSDYISKNGARGGGDAMLCCLCFTIHVGICRVYFGEKALQVPTKHELRMSLEALFCFPPRVQLLSAFFLLPFLLKLCK